MTCVLIFKILEKNRAIIKGTGLKGMKTVCYQKLWIIAQGNNQKHKK